MSRYTLCPFYIDENKKSISCEDVCRQYSSMDEKNEWMKMYCDSMDWMRCPYAVDLNEAYYRKEKGDEQALENNKIKSMKKEIRSLSTKLGAAEKKNERLQSKAELFHKKWRESENALVKYKDNVAGQLQGIVETYETRLAYLMDTYAGGEFEDADVDKWLEGKSFAIVYKKRDDGKGRPYWKVVFEDADNDDGTIQGDAGDEGTEEA